MLVPHQLYLHFQVVATSFRSCPWSCKADLKCAIDLESLFSHKCCLLLKYHHFRIYIPNNLMLVPHQLYLHFQVVATSFRSSPWSCKADLKCAIDLESWFSHKCCQLIKYHHFSIYIPNNLMLVPHQLYIHFQVRATSFRSSLWPYKQI